MNTSPQSAAVCDALAPFGTTVFATISQRAAQANAVNLGQGFPDFDGPPWLLNAAADAITQGPNQYAPLPGVPQLRAAIAHNWHRTTNIQAHPDTDVTVTAGCTEAIAATMLGLLNPGDEVVLFEPFYDSYRATVALARATPRFVPLTPDADGTFRFDPKDLDAAITPRTRAVLINTPHNPTGKVFTPDELDAIAERCRAHNLIAIADEVYDRLVLPNDDNLTHTPIATREGMAERTITLNSIGKSFSVTGWKVGWAIAPPPLTAAVRAAHQFLTYAVATPLQHACALALIDDRGYAAELRRTLTRNRDTLAASLRTLGLHFRIPPAGYFILTDHTTLAPQLSADDDWSVCNTILDRAGVAAIPASPFYDNHTLGRTQTRFAFCKSPAVIKDAVDRITALADSL